jgi:hypothetical protein
MKQRLAQFDWGYLAAAILPIIGFVPILKDTIVQTSDGTVHVYRILAVLQMAQTGNLWPRWIPYLHVGYGYPMFDFYPLGIYHIALFLSLFGITAPVAYNIITALAWIIGSVGMYALVRQFFPGRAAILAVMLWTYAPMRMYEVWHQGSLPTFMATAFIPWVFWGLVKVLRTPGPRSMLALALTFSAMIMSHPPVTFMTGLYLGPAALLVPLGSARRDLRLALRRFAYGAGALALAGGLTAIFLLPLFTEIRYIASSQLASDVIPYLRSQFYKPNEIFTLPLPPDQTDLLSDMPVSLGLLGGILSLLGLVALVRRRQYGLAALLLAALAFTVFMLLAVSFPVWLHIPYLAEIRASTRFLSVGALFIALAGGASLLLLPERWQWAGLTVLMPVTLLIVMPMSFANSRTVRLDNLSAPDEIHEELTNRVMGTTSYDEFDPVWGKQVPTDQPADIDAYASDPMRIQVKELDVLKQYPNLKAEQVDSNTVRVTVADERPVRFRQFYFPGWTATMDDKPVEVYPEAEFGLLTVRVPAGEHIIKLWYAGTPVQTTGTAVSAVSILILAAIWYKTRPQPVSQAATCFLSRRASLVISASAVGFALVNGLIITPDTLLFRMKSPPDKPVYMQTAVSDKSFGDYFDFLGYTVPQTTATPGDTFRITLFWHPKQIIDKDYTPVLQLVNLPVTKAWAAEEPPLLGNNHTPGYPPDHFASDPHKMRIFDDAPPYVGRLSVQLRDTATGKFVPLADGSDRIVLDPIIRINGANPSVNKMLDYKLSDSVELWCSSVKQDGDVFNFDLYWHVNKTPAQDLRLLVHGLDVSGNLVVQNDSLPMNGDYPPIYWLPGQNLIDAHTLPATPAIKTIAVGLYDSVSGERLPVTQNGQQVGDNRIMLPITQNSCQP